MTINRLKNQGKLVALVLLDERAHRLQYTLPPELPEVSLFRDKVIVEKNSICSHSVMISSLEDIV